MSNYIIIAIGWLVGQIGYATVSAYIIQKDMPSISYGQALKEYFKKEIGSFAMAFSALLILLFIFPDYFDSSIKRADLLNKEALTIKERFIVFQRTAAVIVGGLCQHMLYVAFKKGKKAIHDYADKNQVDSST